MASLEQHDPGRSNPLDLAEELVAANDWNWERASDRELVVEISARWCDCSMAFVWEEEINAIFFSCHFGPKVPETKRAAVHELLAAVNENLWLGHFDLVTETAAPIFRHTVPLRGLPGASIELLEDLVDTARTECDRFYLALQLIMWGGQPVTAALSAAMMDTIGEA